VFQFDPDAAEANEKLPAILYYHGGAFVLTYASTHVEAVDYYAQQAKCRVFMVDYRLAPQHVFPRSFNDCYAALEWLHRNADELGVQPDKIAVMGDSAGGCFSAAVAQKALDENKIRLCGQVLIYPSLDWQCNTYSARTYLDAPMFNGVANKKMWQIYLRDYTGLPVPQYASPADRKNLAGLPRAYVETAEFDPLRDEGLTYAERLKTDGVEVTLHETKGTVHGYDTVPESEITKDTFKRRIAFLQSIFS
jgi:acetyl esterase/lipase